MKITEKTLIQAKYEYLKSQGEKTSNTKVTIGRMGGLPFIFIRDSAFSNMRSALAYLRRIVETEICLEAVRS